MRKIYATTPGICEKPPSCSIPVEEEREIVYEGLDAGLVPALVEVLFGSLNSDDGTPAIIHAALAYLNLAMIPPLSDGNGRMARCLQTLILAREGILDSRFSSIEQYLGRNTKEYYSVLGAVGGGSTGRCFRGPHDRPVQNGLPSRPGEARSSLLPPGA
jgi:Fic family protein